MGVQEYRTWDWRVKSLPTSRARAALEDVSFAAHRQQMTQGYQSASCGYCLSLPVAYGACFAF